MQHAARSRARWRQLSFSVSCRFAVYYGLLQPPLYVLCIKHQTHWSTHWTPSAPSAPIAVRNKDAYRIECNGVRPTPPALCTDTCTGKHSVARGFLCTWDKFDTYTRGRAVSSPCWCTSPHPRGCTARSGTCQKFANEPNTRVTNRDRLSTDTKICTRENKNYMFVYFKTERGTGAAQRRLMP